MWERHAILAHPLGGALGDVGPPAAFRGAPLFVRPLPPTSYAEEDPLAEEAARPLPAQEKHD